LDGGFWADGCLWALAPQCSPSPKCAVYLSSALREHWEPRLPAKSRRNPAGPKADFQWRDRLDLDTRLLLNERVDRQSNGSWLQIYASRMAESQALLA
jgi:hypothetical protein